MGIISLVSSKKGKLYLKFLVALAIFAAAVFASAPSATPRGGAL